MRFCAECGMKYEGSVKYCSACEKAVGALFEYLRSGFSFRVFPNRIEAKRGPFTKTETILIRDVRDIDRGPRTSTLEINTNDGQRHKYMLGVQLDEARRAIRSML